MISMSESHPKQYPSSQSTYKSYLGSLSNSLPNMRTQGRRNEINKLQRPAPRSMRTIRSKLFARDEESSLSSGPLDSPKEQSWASCGLKEKESMEKPIDGIGKKSNSYNDDEVEEDWDGSDVIRVETNSFDFSQAFSDFSVYSSDISGELLRLATATSPAYNKIDTAVLKESAAQTQLMGRLIKSRNREEEQDGGNLHASSLTMSESINEFPEPENLDAAIKALVENLGPCNSTESQRNAAGELRLLAKNKIENRVMIAKAGAIHPLVSLLLSEDSETQENTVTALLNLSLCESNKIEITSAGAIKPLIDVLKTGTSIAKQNAACTLLSLSLVDDNKVSIGASGAIPPLVSLLINGTSRGKKDAATTLYTLSSVHKNRVKAIRAGAIKPLVDLMADPSSGMVDKAVVVLSNLASVPDGKNAIVDAGGIPVLVEILESGSQKGKEFATATLLHICQDSYLYRTLVSREGTIPPLVELSQSGTTRTKHKAATLLQYLREPRQGSLDEKKSEFSTS